MKLIVKEESNNVKRVKDAARTAIAVAFAVGRPVWLKVDRQEVLVFPWQKEAEIVNKFYVVEEIKCAARNVVILKK